LTHPQLRPIQFGAQPAASIAIQPKTDSIQHSMLLDQDAPVIRTALSTSSSEDGPAPALLVYLTLILVGSAVAVGLARHHLHREV
jgi:hypothetical protein